MSDSEFTKLAEKTISLIAEIIEEQDNNYLIDIDFHDDILTLETEDGVFVINKQSAVKEIWLSSPISGPYHFFYENGVWKTKSNILLKGILEQELNMIFSI